MQKKTRKSECNQGFCNFISKAFFFFPWHGLDRVTYDDAVWDQMRYFLTKIRLIGLGLYLSFCDENGKCCLTSKSDSSTQFLNNMLARKELSDTPLN